MYADQATETPGHWNPGRDQVSMAPLKRRRTETAVET